MRIQATTHDRRGRIESTTHVDTPAYLVRIEPHQVAPRAVITPEQVEGLGVDARTVSLFVDGADLTDRQATDLSEAVTAVSRQAGFYVERGYRADDEAVIIQLVLGTLGAVLMLGGT